MEMHGPFQNFAYLFIFFFGNFIAKSKHHCQHAGKLPPNGTLAAISLHADKVNGPVSLGVVMNFILSKVLFL